MIQLEGAYTALVTPFRDDGSQSIDWEAFDRLVSFQIEGKVAGIVPCGTTGESPTLSQEEQVSLIRRAVELTRGKIQVIAGAGSNSTRTAVAMARAAEEAGADAVMTVVPYYNRPTQEGLFVHFSEVARAVHCPVVLYNVPARTVADLSVETVERIAHAHANVVGIKEATGNVLRAQEITRRLGHRLAILSGVDELVFPMMTVGARGVISVTSNLLPRDVADVVSAAIRGDYRTALARHLALLPVHESMFLESSPAPLKEAMSQRKMIQNVVRAPLTGVTEATRRALAATLQAYSAPPPQDARPPQEAPGERSRPSA